ncbi:hypothetical protein [Sporosarcina sp. FSL W7-1283]|uniref:hypothetical protein n=1 Tax=Sporosarcina sp. FSL W7-1283 TaxID=2921560 RepID=UPI0030FBA45F
MDNFFLKYEEGLNKLEKELDKLLQGLWKETDHLQFGFKTEIQRWGEQPYLIAEFNDYSASEVGLQLYYEEFGDTLHINRIEYASDVCAYSDDVLNLKYAIKGKSDKEMLILEIDSLEKEYSEAEESIFNLKCNLKQQEDDREKVKDNITKLQNELIS